MSSRDGDDRARARERIAALVRSPEDSRRLLPGIMGSLESDDDYLRLSAACGICLAGTAEPDLLPYLVHRLVDRLHDETARAEAVFAFEYLATQFPERVDDVLQDIREESGREPLAYTRTGGFRRSHIYSPSMGRQGVGRTRIAGHGQDPGPQQVYNDDGEPIERRGGPAGRDDGAETGERDTSGTERSDGSDGETTDAENERHETTAGRRPDWGVQADVLETIVAESAFEDITILADRERGRFAEIYRTLAIARGTERAVGLRLFRRPGSNTEGFGRHLSVALDQWNRVSASDHVVSLYDRGERPRPWAAVAYTERTLADRGRLGLDEALWNGIALARGVATLHDNDVVHGGLDPRSIAYTGTVIDDERQAPLIDHVGLAEAFRFHFDPAECLDPRYAAPEYFDPQFGGIDHATDIYQLGTTLYRLFTGIAPYDGEARDVKEQVLDGAVVPPSGRDATIPEQVDDVISKAMAAQKLTRYETITRLEQDLLRLRDQLGTDGD